MLFGHKMGYKLDNLKPKAGWRTLFFFVKLKLLKMPLNLRLRREPPVGTGSIARKKRRHCRNCEALGLLRQLNMEEIEALGMSKR